jgi:hypothetical protein
MDEKRKWKKEWKELNKKQRQRLEQLNGFLFEKRKKMTENWTSGRY